MIPVKSLGLCLSPLPILAPLPLLFLLSFSNTILITLFWIVEKMISSVRFTVLYFVIFLLPASNWITKRKTHWLNIVHLSIAGSNSAASKMGFIKARANFLCRSWGCLWVVGSCNQVRLMKLDRSKFPKKPGGVRQKLFTTGRIAEREHISADVCHSRFYIWNAEIARIFTKSVV